VAEDHTGEPQPTPRRVLVGDAARELVPIVLLYSHLAAEQTIDEDKVYGGEHHTDAPPSEPNGEPVGGAGGVVDGEAVLRLDGGQDLWVDGEGGRGFHRPARFSGLEATAS
jgi:hypothetical protein